MAAICKVVAVMTLVTMILGHECHDYPLSASDQSLVDMMKHYLHTSRKDGCSGKQEELGVTYIRWGRKKCPDTAELVYTGQAGGNHHGYKGGEANYVCLPNDPENGKPYGGDNAGLFGSEYEVGGRKSILPETLNNQEVSCAVCRRVFKSSVLVVPGRKTCYSGWKLEYSGILMTDHINHNPKEYACVDVDAESLDQKAGDENAALFYVVTTKCGSLRCPPYTDAAEVNCVVCTK